MILENAKVPVLGFAAFSGTGKTTLLLKLLPLVQARGYHIGMVKHAHHTFEIDHAGKDSFALRKSGVEQIVIGSRDRLAFIQERQPAVEPRLDELLAELDQESLDLVLVEGFKHEPVAKIELHRPSLGQALLFPHDPDIIAIAHDAPTAIATSLPQLNLNNVDGIVDFIAAFIADERKVARGSR